MYIMEETVKKEKFEKKSKKIKRHKMVAFVEKLPSKHFFNIIREIFYKALMA